MVSKTVDRGSNPCRPAKHYIILDYDDKEDKIMFDDGSQWFVKGQMHANIKKRVVLKEVLEENFGALVEQIEQKI